MYDIHWPHPHTPERADRELCSMGWDELPADASGEILVAAALINATVVVRRTWFRDCRLCERSMPPEWYGDTCHGCSEQHFGVVH